MFVFDLGIESLKPPQSPRFRPHLRNKLTNAVMATLFHAFHNRTLGPLCLSHQEERTKNYGIWTHITEYAK